MERCTFKFQDVAYYYYDFGYNDLAHVRESIEKDAAKKLEMLDRLLQQSGAKRESYLFTDGRIVQIYVGFGQIFPSRRTFAIWHFAAKVITFAIEKWGSLHYKPGVGKFIQLPKELGEIIQWCSTRYESLSTQFQKEIFLTVDDKYLVCTPELCYLFEKTSALEAYLESER